MRLWINFEEKDIKKRKNGWKDGDEFYGQLIFDSMQDFDNCRFEFTGDKVYLNFDNGYIEMTKKEFGGLFK